MEFENLLYEVNNGILYMTLNRPEARNALNPAMWKDISNAVNAAREDDRIHVVILTSVGDKAFASGADIRELHDREALGQLLGTTTRALKNLEDLYKPVICAINGYALGGGCELAMACDIRIATARSRFGQPEVGIGIIPGGGGTQRLTRLVGLGKARELIYTGRVIYADEAEKIGLVNKVTGNTREELIAAAEEMAQTMMKKGPVALELAKISMNVGYDTDLTTGLMVERLAQTVAFYTDDRKEGTASFLEKRDAEFAGK